MKKIFLAIMLASGLALPAYCESNEVSTLNALMISDSIDHAANPNGYGLFYGWHSSKKKKPIVEEQYGSIIYKGTKYIPASDAEFTRKAFEKEIDELRKEVATLKEDRDLYLRKYVIESRENYFHTADNKTSEATSK